MKDKLAVWSVIELLKRFVVVLAVVAFPGNQVSTFLLTTYTIPCTFNFWCHKFNFVANVLVWEHGYFTT